MPKRKIIDIKPQVRNPRRRTLIFDDGSVFGISEDVFISNDVKIGSDISDSVLDNLVDDELKVKVYNSAIRLLGYRMRSCAELRKRLVDKDYPNEIITEVIDKLLNTNYLNDEEFAIAFANDKVLIKKIGPIALRKEFMPHQIEAILLDKIIQAIYEKYPIPELIQQLLSKKGIAKRSTLEKKDKKRIYDMLLRKGFSWSEISSVFSDMEIT